MTKEEIEKSAREKADIIIKREKNLEKWYKTASREYDRREHSLDKESAKMDLLFRELDSLREKFSECSEDEDSAEYKSLSLRLEFIAKKVKKFQETEIFLTEQACVLCFVADEISARKDAYIAELEAEFERKKALFEQLSMQKEMLDAK